MNAFRTLDISDPRFETDGLRFATVKSRCLRGRADLTLFAPEEAKSKTDVPLAILLHGVYGSHWAWAFRAGVHRTLQRLVGSGVIPPMALAMPSDGLWGDGSGYVRHASQDFEGWIVEEVPRAAAAVMPWVSEESPLFLGGLSMGGFGALRIGAKYGRRFQAVSGHSSITHFNQLKLFVEEDLAAFRPAPEDCSVLETILAHRRELPALRFDCGQGDPLIEPNRELHRRLGEEGIRHVYGEFAGGHDWNYWERHIEESFRFFGRKPGMIPM